MQISTRPKAKGKFARATENNAEEALLSGAMNKFTRLVSGQLLGLWSGLGSGFSSGGGLTREILIGEILTGGILICHHRGGIIVL